MYQIPAKLNILPGLRANRSKVTAETNLSAVVNSTYYYDLLISHKFPTLYTVKKRKSNFFPGAVNRTWLQLK